MTNSYARLTGEVDNGLRWTYPDKRMRKYIFTEKTESETMWGMLRHNIY